MKIKVKKIDEKLAENYTKIKIGGIAEIRYRDNVIKCRNKWTRYFMSSIIVFIADQRAPDGSVSNLGTPYRTATAGMAWGVTARVGIDEYTSTNPDMSDLVNKIDIAPNSITRRLIKEPDYSLYIAEFTFVWNAGTLPDIYVGATAEGDIDGKVGEFGVYLRTDSDNWTTGTLNPSRASGGKSGYNVWGIPLGEADIRLCARIASADGAFNAFEYYGSIDPLTFKWRFQVAIV